MTNEPEIRLNEDGTLDEVVGGTGIHLEQMDGNHWWMAVYYNGGRVTVNFHARVKITANVENERDLAANTREPAGSAALTSEQAERIVAALDENDGGYESIAAFVRALSSPSAPLGERDAEDAKRYRWLRTQFVNDTPKPKWVMTRPEGIRLGADCPSGDRMDEAIDAALASLSLGDEK